MHSTGIPRTAQQQTVSIRVSNSLREFLERSKDVIAREYGQSVSMSDVARMLIESARSDCLDFRFEVADLQQEPTDALWAIRKKWEKQQALSRAEWILLGHYIQLACEGVSENPAMPRASSFVPSRVAANDTGVARRPRRRTGQVLSREPGCTGRCTERSTA
jgi:hypothetical protein